MLGIIELRTATFRDLLGRRLKLVELITKRLKFTGKMKLKFEMRSYQEMVVVPMRQMSEDNQQLVWLTNMVVKEQKHSKALEESFAVVTQKLRKTTEENRIVRQRTKMQHERNKDEMDYQEQFFKNQINVINQSPEDKERDFEKRLQEARVKVKQSTGVSVTQKDDKLRRDMYEEAVYKVLSPTSSP